MEEVFSDNWVSQIELQKDHCSLVVVDCIGMEVEEDVWLLDHNQSHLN